jgi:multidrug transporter EmrE-like cation transporter
MPARLFPITMLILFEATADYFATKRGNGGQKAIIAFTAIFFYIVCNTFWLFALKNGVGLGKWNIIFAVWSSIFAIGLWIMVFHENYSPIQMLGMGLGIISLLLVNYE